MGARITGSLSGSFHIRILIETILGGCIPASFVWTINLFFTPVSMMNSFFAPSFDMNGVFITVVHILTSTHTSHLAFQGKYIYILQISLVTSLSGVEKISFSE
jgi:hypothetical protein